MICRFCWMISLRPVEICKFSVFQSINGYVQCRAACVKDRKYPCTPCKAVNGGGNYLQEPQSHFESSPGMCFQFLLNLNQQPMISCLVGVFKRGMESLSKTWLEKKHVGYTLCRILQGPVIKRPLYIYSPHAGAKQKLTIERGNNLSIKLPYPLLPAYHRKHIQAKKQVKERNWLQSIHLRTICYIVTVNPFKTVVFNIWKTHVHIHCPHGF